MVELVCASTAETQYHVTYKADLPAVSTFDMLTVTTPVGWDASATVINMELLQQHNQVFHYSANPNINQ